MALIRLHHVTDRGGLPCQEADATELERAYRDHWTPLVRLAWLMTGSRPDAEDLVQGAFVRYSLVDPPPARPAAYLRATVVNAAHDLFRRRSIERRLPAPPEPIVLAPEIQEVWDAVRQLSPDHREVLVLRYYADLPAEEISRILDCPVGTVRSRIARALAKLREVVP